MKKKDPGTYAKMSVPFESQEALDAAFLAFSEELKALREKHRIRDVYTVVGAAVAVGSDGEPGEFLSTICIGDKSHALHMVATAFGFEKADHEAMTAKCLKDQRGS